MSDLGRYPNLLEVEMGRKLTAQDCEKMNKEYEKAERDYYEHLMSKEKP